MIVVIIIIVLLVALGAGGFFFGFIPSTKPYYKKKFEAQDTGGYTCELFESADNAPIKIIGEDETPSGDYADAMTFWKDKCNTAEPVVVETISPVSQWINQKAANGISPETQEELAKGEYELALETSRLNPTNDKLVLAATLAKLIWDTTVNNRRSGEAADAEAQRLIDDAAELADTLAGKDEEEKRLLGVAQNDYNDLVEAEAVIMKEKGRDSTFAPYKALMLAAGNGQIMVTTTNTPAACIADCEREKGCAAVQFLNNTRNCYKIMNTNPDAPGKSTLETTQDTIDTLNTGFRRVGKTLTAGSERYKNQNNEECGRFIISRVQVAEADSMEQAVFTDPGTLPENLKNFCDIKGWGVRNWDANSGSDYEWKKICSEAYRNGCHLPCKASAYGAPEFKALGGDDKNQLYIGELIEDGAAMIQGDLTGISSAKDDSGRPRGDHQESWDNAIKSVILGPGCETMELDNDRWLDKDFITLHADGHALKRFAENDFSEGHEGPLITPLAQHRAFGWEGAGARLPRQNARREEVTKGWMTYNRDLSPFVADITAKGTYPDGGPAPSQDGQPLAQGYAASHFMFDHWNIPGDKVTSFRVSPRPILNNNSP